MSAILFTAGTEVNDRFAFNRKKENASAEMEISKKETVELTYALAVLYLGKNLEDGRDLWGIRINDKLPETEKGNDLYFGGSRKLHIKPIGKNILQIRETDENGTEKSWIDLSKETYTISRSPIEPEGQSTSS